MNENYTQDQIAFGVNVIAVYYDAWAGSAGISQQGLQSYLVTNDPNALGELGAAVESISQDTWGPAIVSQAQIDGVSYPSVEELIGAVGDAVGNPSLWSTITSAVSSTGSDISGAASATVGAVKSTAQGIESAANFFTSPGFLLLVGGVVVILGMVMFSPEIKAAGMAVSSITPKKKANPKTLNNKDRAEWINNDEDLYLRWKSSHQSMREFIKDNKEEIDALIYRILNINDANERLKRWDD